MSRDWRGFLEDMLDSCERALAFTAGMDFAAFVSDQKTRSAVQREVFVLGEAAKQLPVEVRHRHASVNWRGLSGLRDVLAHQYFRIDDAILWDVVANELPGLLEKLRRIDATED